MPHVGHGNIKLGAFIQLGTELPYKTRVYQAAQSSCANVSSAEISFLAVWLNSELIR